MLQESFFSHIGGCGGKALDGECSNARMDAGLGEIEAECSNIPEPQVYVCEYVCVCVREYVCVCVCESMCVCACVCVCVCVCV